MPDLFDSVGMSPFGEDTGMVLPDVSNGAPDEQPTTPTGAGTGYYVPSAWESTLLGGLSATLNYALQRDQAKFAAEHGYAPGNATMTPTPTTAAAIGNQRLLLLGAIALGAVVLMRK
jgi:hypothetical protein